MRPIEFTDEQVIQAGKQLQASGRNVTGFALRSIVGGGSATRLRQVWDAHLADQEAAGGLDAELPDDVAQVLTAASTALMDKLGMLARQINGKAEQAAERRVAEAMQSIAEEREAFWREFADAAEAVDKLEQSRNEAQANQQALREQLASLEEANQAQEIELARLRERLEQVQQARQQAVAQAEQVQQELMRAREVSTNALNEAAELRGALNALQAGRQGLSSSPLQTSSPAPDGGASEQRK